MERKHHPLTEPGCGGGSLVDRIDIDDEDGDDVSTGKEEKESCPSVQTFPLPLTVPLFIFTFVTFVV